MARKAKYVARSIAKGYQPKPQQPGKVAKTPLVKPQRKHRKP